MKSKNKLILLNIAFFIASCTGNDFTKDGQRLSDEEIAALCQGNPEGLDCQYINGYELILTDSFERQDTIDASSGFWWRKIINDNGQIISGSAGDNVDVRIFNDKKMGEASDGSRALYFYGREGTQSVHRIYLISNAVDMTKVMKPHGVVISFDYLAIDLDDDEYLSVEVCNDTPEACGVGKKLTPKGLNSDKWEKLVVVNKLQNINDLNGHNHKVSHWRRASTSLFLEDFQKKEFIFRFAVKINEGFAGNDQSQRMVDGVGIDNVKVTAYVINDDETLPPPLEHNDDEDPVIRDDFLY